MFIGAHAILYSKNADADRAFLRDVLQLTHVDVVGGWLIFGLPPAEVAVHPTDGNGSHELYLMCDDIEAFRAEMERRGVATAPIQRARWGILSDVALPGGGKLGVYQPLHARPAPPDLPVAPAGSSAKPAGKSAKPGAAKSRAGKPGAGKPGAGKPGAGSQPATKPPAAKPPTAKPRGTKPSAAKRSAAKPRR